MNLIRGRPVAENTGRALMVGVAFGATLGAAAPAATSAFAARAGGALLGGAAAAGPAVAAEGTEGGRHAGFVAEMAKRTPGEITRAIRSLERVASQHAELLRNPTSKVADFYQRSQAEQASLLRQWTQTVADRTEQANLLKELLK